MASPRGLRWVPFVTPALFAFAKPQPNKLSPVVKIAHYFERFSPSASRFVSLGLHIYSNSPAEGAVWVNGVPERTRTSCPQFRKLLLYPDELRRHADIMYKTRQKILQAKFFLPALFSARQPRLHPRSASTPATRRGLKRHEIFPVYSCQPANFKLLLK